MAARRRVGVRAAARSGWIFTLQGYSTNEGSVKRVSTTDWVRYGPQAEADMTLEGFILLGLIACQEAGE